MTKKEQLNKALLRASNAFITKSKKVKKVEVDINESYMQG